MSVRSVSCVSLHVLWPTFASTQQRAPTVRPHETAVAHFRSQMRREKPAVVPWQESVEQWSDRAEKCVGYINSVYNLDGLCRSFPKRLRELQAKQGERLTF